MAASQKSVIAIAGNPNSGKTTAFNWYTGSRQHVGNYPGITVERKEGAVVLDGRGITLVDLPGTYSLTAYSPEEVAARRVLTEERPGAVLNVVNAGVLERNLYLTVQLLEMGMPVVVALNMMDEAGAQGISIDVRRFEDLTGVKAIPTVARSGKGLENALRAALALADTGKSRTAPLAISYGPDIDEALNAMGGLIDEAGLLKDKYPSRWVALKYLERDEDIITQGGAAAQGVSDTLIAMADKVAAHVKTTLNTYPEALIADYRYGYISSILRQGVVTGAEERKNRIAYSDKADMVLTNRFLGPLIMLGVLYLMYVLTIEVGTYPLGWVESFFEWLSGAVDDAMREGMLKSLVVSGIVGGVGGVLGFVPLIMIMFLLIALLEDSGYMARVAYMMDRVFRVFGLHGASVMPFIVSGGIAGGCAVPGVMATRTLRSRRERLATMLTAPFMACGAKVPVFLLLVTIFFEQNQALIMFLLTLTGWVAALLVARLLRSTLIRGEATPFVMELPPYRFPTISGVLIHTWERTWQYIKKAGTIILAISILIWAAMSFPALSGDVADTFEARKAFLEDQLAELPSRKLSAAIEERAGRLAALPEGDARAAGLQDEIRALTEEFGELPVNRLQAEADALAEQLGKLPEDPAAEELRKQIKKYAAALETLDESDAGAKTVRRQLEATMETFAATPAGAIELVLAEKQKTLDAMPERRLEAQLREVGNEEAGEALRFSYAGRVGAALEGISGLAGFDWRANIALIGGIAAKEVVISTLGTAYSLGEIDEDNESTLADRIRADAHWTKANAVALLLFTLLYSPCFVTLAVIRQESGAWKWMFFSLFFNLILAYGVAVAANQILLRL